MKILNVSVVFPPAKGHGGTPITAHSCAKALIKLGHDVFTICTGDLKNDGSPVIDEITEWDEVPVVYCSKRLGIMPYYSSSLRKWVADMASENEIASIRSSWTYIGPVASKECRRKRVPYIAYPEGTFDKWALQRGRFKKWLFWNIWDRKYFQSANAVVGLTKYEVESIRSMGLSTRTEHIPNGIDIENYTRPVNRNIIDEQFTQLKSNRFVLFLGRLHPIKGLVQLVLAWSKIYKKIPDCKLVIAGPDDGEMKKIIGIAKENNIIEHILLTGEITGKIKLGFLQNAELVVLPSFTEGFSITSLEAMACSRPLLVTKACHMPEIVQYRTGYEMPNNKPEIIAHNLLFMLSDNVALNEMGQNAFSLVSNMFTWERVGKMTADLLTDVLRNS